MYTYFLHRTLCEEELHVDHCTLLNWHQYFADKINIGSFPLDILLDLHTVFSRQKNFFEVVVLYRLLQNAGKDRNEWILFLIHIYLMKFWRQNVILLTFKKLVHNSAQSHSFRFTSANPIWLVLTSNREHGEDRSRVTLLYSPISGKELKYFNQTSALIKNTFLHYFFLKPNLLSRSKTEL